MSEKSRRATQGAALAALCPDSRGRRFASRAAGHARPTFADLAAMPAWAAFDEAVQKRAAFAAGLLAARSAIDRELSGERLGALAEVVGESFFDAVCAADRPATSDRGLLPLPRPDQLAVHGRDILEAALPAVLRRIVPGAAGNADARCIADRAIEIASVAR
jgi:hypothetical protein